MCLRPDIDVHSARLVAPTKWQRDSMFEIGDLSVIKIALGVLLGLVLFAVLYALLSAILGGVVISGTVLVVGVALWLLSFLIGGQAAAGIAIGLALLWTMLLKGPDDTLSFF
jgi:hypothetical protein